MKKGLVLALGFFVISAGLSFAREAKVPPAAFTLAAIGGDPAPIPFTLALGSAEPIALAGPGGAGVIEDPGWPYRTAIGWEALANNTGGIGYNTACGFQALQYNTVGYRNTAAGSSALLLNIDGYCNTAIGAAALALNLDGYFNMASGENALRNNRSGIFNTACGAQAFYENLNGSYNTALGADAGLGPKNGNYNIYVGAKVQGDLFDNNTIRIGKGYDSTQTPPAGQNRTFIAGIVESPMTAEMSPAVVGITSEGRLGTMSSDLLPQGPQGPQGVPGPVGDGLISGSLLFLLPNIAPPAGYTFLGTSDFSLTVPGTKKIKLTVNVYQKQ